MAASRTSQTALARFWFDLGRDADGAVVRIHGIGDERNAAPQLRRCLLGLMRAGERRVVVDASDARCLDVSSLQAIALAARKLDAAGGELLLRRAPHLARRVARALGCSHVLAAE